MTYKTVMGTHHENFRSIAATGRRFSCPVIDMFRIEQHRIVEFWGIFDELRFLQQLGVVGEHNNDQA